MSDLKSIIAAQIYAVCPSQVWVPTDFAQLGNRDAIDKTLQRMVQAGDLRRIDRGLYDKPTLNRLTKRPTTPDYRAEVEAIARRDQLRLLVDGNASVAKPIPGKYHDYRSHYHLTFDQEVGQEDFRAAVNRTLRVTAWRSRCCRRVASCELFHQCWVRT